MKEKRKMTFRYEGKEYETIEKCCEEFGVSYCAVTTDVCRNGATHADAITKRREKKPFEFEGVSYRSRNACCRSRGVAYANVKQKAVQDGIEFEEALRLILDSPRNPNGNKIFYGGRMWKSKRALAVSYGLVKETVLACARENGLTFTEALDLLLSKGKGRKPEEKDVRANACFEFRGKYYASPSQACGEYGIFYPNVKKSLDSGMSQAEAVEYWVKKQEERNRSRRIEFEGTSYPSVRACCRELGVKPEAVRKALKKQESDS